MATRNFKHESKDYVIETDRLPNGTFIVRVGLLGALGLYLRETPNPSSIWQGPPLVFDTEAQALAAGEQFVRTGTPDGVWPTTAPV